MGNTVTVYDLVNDMRKAQKRYAMGYNIIVQNDVDRIKFAGDFDDFKASSLYDSIQDKEVIHVSFYEGMTEIVYSESEGVY